ncbi:hypothetical protein BDZ91DRAFT_803138 [Kalaharituber pfeilii]|nr:hypothetical protein BDZ91DRAFT_803138 [Kalaharituber pfeilii]
MEAIAMKGEFERDRFLGVLENCLLGEEVSLGDHSLLDTRYFYIAEDGTGQCEAGLIRRVMAQFLREQKGYNLFLSKQWLKMIESSGNNPSMLGS